MECLNSFTPDEMLAKHRKRKQNIKKHRRGGVS
jgi:hypothetical protein